MGWTPMQRLKARRAALRKAKNEYAAAQAELEAARRKDLHPRQRLVDAVLRLRGVVAEKTRLVKLQEKVVAKRDPALKPERTIISPNRSSRGGVKPRLIVLHITVSHNRPGMADVDGILQFFKRPSTQASSHIVNDREGHDARCVPDAEKAWTQAAFNPQALAIEQIEFSAGRTRKQWLNESRKQLDNTALWCAYWAKKYGIPLKHSTSKGVCQHMELGAAGGGHSDCGPGYPLDYVLEKAREYLKEM